MNYRTIQALFHDRVERYRGRDAFYVRQGGAWAGYSWDRFAREAHEFAYALIATGCKQGSSVAILMGNVPEWPVADIGTILAGGVSVGLYPTSSAEQCQYIIEHSDAEVVLVDTAAQLEKILRVRAQLPKVKAVVVLDERAAIEHASVTSYTAFLNFGRGQQERAQLAVNERTRAAGSDDTVIMVYTSGTTGQPKGACLSHRYVINSVESLRASILMDETDVTFSYLPYCHVAERISGLYNRLYAGSPAYFVDEPAKLWEYMLEVGPTIFASLPRFFEKIHARVVSELAQAAPDERAQFAGVLRLGKEISRLRQTGARVPESLQRAYDETAGPAVERVRGYFGGRIRLATSGGAPLPLEIAEFFDALGITILQAYGLTENVCVAFNRPDNYKFGTVGPAMPGCEIKLMADGEILVRSEMMFSGYYKQPEQTAEIMRDGWLLTGDLGAMDEAGFLRITGRKKELIVTSTGKNVAPALVENMLKEHHLISHALVHGDGRSYLVALITLNQIEAEQYARANNIQSQSFADLTRQAEIVNLVDEIVAGVNRRVSSTEAIRKVAILAHDFSVEADEVTPTMKVKRNVVAQRYEDILASLYA